MTNRTSTKLQKAYMKDLESCKTIGELLWIYADFAQDMRLTCDDLDELIRDYCMKRATFEMRGDRPSRATRPACRR